MFDDILTPAQKQAVGEVALTSAVLDHSLDSLIRWTCNFKDEVGDLFVGSLQISGKLDLFSKLVSTKKKLSKRQAKKLEFLKGTIASNIKDRNTIIHGQWSRWGTKPMIKLRDIFKYVSAPDPVAKHRTAKSKTTRMMKAANIEIVAKRLRVCDELLWRFWADNFLEKKDRTVGIIPTESFERLAAKVQSFRLSN